MTPVPSLFLFFETEFLCVALAVLELTLKIRLASNQKSACLCLPSAGIKGMCHYHLSSPHQLLSYALFTINHLNTDDKGFSLIQNHWALSTADCYNFNNEARVFQRHLDLKDPHSRDPIPGWASLGRTLIIQSPWSP